MNFVDAQQVLHYLFIHFIIFLYFMKQMKRIKKWEIFSFQSLYEDLSMYLFISIYSITQTINQ